MAERRKSLLAVILVAALLTQGCATVADRTLKGALIGGVVGGGLAYATSDNDGIISRSGVTVMGAIAGAGIGAIVGALFGAGEEAVKPKTKTALPPIPDMP
jgi:hypothetical protein